MLEKPKFLVGKKKIREPWVTLDQNVLKTFADGINGSSFMPKPSGKVFEINQLPHQCYNITLFLIFFIFFASFTIQRL